MGLGSASLALPAPGFDRSRHGTRCRPTWNLGKLGLTFTQDTASADKTARLWDAASGKAIGEPMRHDDEVLSARFSPDGHWVVTASSDTARVWKVARHQAAPKAGAAAK